MEKLSIQGKAGDPVWGMVNTIEGVEYIGLRLDHGDAGTVYLTLSQAHDVIETLNSLLSQI